MSGFNPFGTNKPKKPLELQLTAMIDVFSMIVIFLIFGTVFGAADIVIPGGMKIPKSASKEGIESAPRILIHQQKVTLSLSNQSIPIQDFKSEDRLAAYKNRLKPVLAEYKEKKKLNKDVVAPLNLIADRETPYEQIFDVISFFRELGFNTILFVASGGESK